jgi:hypothetical protein
VITLSNQQGYASDTCGQAERKAVREQASAPAMRRSARPALRPRRGARRELRPSARRAAQGVGTHLVHEHRRDLGDGGQDQPRLTACISGKSQR